MMLMWIICAAQPHLININDCNPPNNTYLKMCSFFTQSSWSQDIFTDCRTQQEHSISKPFRHQSNQPHPVITETPSAGYSRRTFCIAPPVWDVGPIKQAGKVKPSPVIRLLGGLRAADATKRWLPSPETSKSALVKWYSSLSPISSDSLWTGQGLSGSMWDQDEDTLLNKADEQR